MPEREEQLRPCIGELLRTCIQPPSMKLRVDHVVKIRSPQHDSTTTSDAAGGYVGRCVRVYLSDGQLTIQALLCQLSDNERVRPGHLLDLINIDVRKSRRLNGNGYVVFLAVKEYKIIEQERIMVEGTEGGFIREQAEASSPASWRKRTQVPTPHPDNNETSPKDQSIKSKIQLKRLRFEELPPSSQLPGMSSPDLSDSDKEGNFETITPNGAAVQRRKQNLRELQSSSCLTPRSSVASKGAHQQTTDELEAPAMPNGSIDPRGSPQQSNTKPRLFTDLPVHTLASLIHPHARLPKSYQCNVFGIVTWISPNIITKPPFPPKRHMKIHDISILNQYVGVTLAVFVDAREFHPQPGTVALCRGVTMQRCGEEVILNAYKTLKDRVEEGEWFVDDIEWLMNEGWDVKGLRAWWEQRQQSRPGSRGSDHGPAS